MCLVRDKKLQGLKIGKAWRFTEQAVEKLITVSDEIDFRPSIIVIQKKRGRKAG
jgi:peptidyl-tRNA hydrolase